MEIKTLECIHKKSILTAFNESFADYFIPFKLTEKQLASKMDSDSINLSLSVGAFDNGKLIAFILHGFEKINNQKVVYNGGTGVIPEKRGFGLTQKMYQFILPILEKRGVNKIILEVIDKNIQAIKSYEKSGFTISRELVCCKGSFEHLSTNKDITIKKLEDYKWEYLESFWDIHPTWQNSNKVLDDLRSTNISLGAYVNTKLVGYVVFNLLNQRIQQIAVAKVYRRKGIASTLLAALKGQNENNFSVINVDKKSESTVEFFHSVGLKIYLEQLEMQLKIKNVYS